MRSLVPKARIEAFEAFSWQVEEIETPLFVLPDFVALAIDEEGRAASLLGVKNMEVTAVLMPLSPSRMLVGRRDNAAIDLLRFNALAAPNCLSFFVSASTLPELKVLAKDIGSSVAAELDSALRQAASEFRAQLEQLHADGNRPVSAPKSAGNVTLVTDYLTPDAVSGLSTALEQLMQIVHGKFDLSSLLRIHAAADYDQALATLDRGALGTSEPAPKASQGGFSAAYNVPVEQDGKRGVVMVLRDVIALGLLSEDDHHFATAASVFMAQMARIGTDALLAEVFADGLKTGTACDKLLISHALPAWKSWFIAGYASLLQSEVRAHHREVLIEQLQALRGRLESIRRAYRMHGDVDKLLSEALGEVAQVLATAAAAASSAFGGIPETQGDEAFNATLDSLGYLHWFEILRADIAEIWREGDNYPTQDAFLALNRHLERLLMVGAIFLWEDKGQGRVEVPYWSDWEWMAAKQTGDANARL